MEAGYGFGARGGEGQAWLCIGSIGDFDWFLRVYWPHLGCNGYSMSDGWRRWCGDGEVLPREVGEREGKV